MRVAHTEPKRCPLRASNSSVVGAYHASEHVLITQLDSDTYDALCSLMQWHRLKLSWHPTRANGAQVLQRCHTACSNGRSLARCRPATVNCSKITSACNARIGAVRHACR